MRNKNKIWKSALPGLAVLTLITSVSCSNINNSTSNNKKVNQKELFLKNEYKKSYNFLIDTMNKNDNTPTSYGMVPDRFVLEDLNSVKNSLQSNDSIGWLLSALVVGAENKWIDKNKAKEMSKKIIKSILKLDNEKGFITHFSNRDGLRAGSFSEYSSSTTFLIFAGLITAESYFKDKEITKNTRLFVDRIDWNYWTKPKSNGKGPSIYMGYNDSKANSTYKKGFTGDWGMSAEQQLLYVMYSASKNISEKKAKEMYLSFDRPKEKPKNLGYVYEPAGTLFTYQYSHSYIDFKKYSTPDNIDWFENTKKAILMDKKTSKFLLDKAGIENDGSYWGLSANDRGKGIYRVIGSREAGKFDKWFAPWGQIASIPFYNEAIDDIYNVKNKIPFSYDEKYGLKDGYSPNGESSNTILSLDKGLEVVALSNYFDGTIWKYFNSSSFTKDAIKKMGWDAKKIGKNHD